MHWLVNGDQFKQRPHFSGLDRLTYSMYYMCADEKKIQQGSWELQSHVEPIC